MEYTWVDRKTELILRALASAPVFGKKGQVKARPAVAGEQVITTLASGATETVNTAHSGDWIITNPSGKKYIVSQAKFEGRYEPTEIDGVYRAKGFCRAILNPFKQPIQIMASWGEPQTGDERCMIADTCDENGEKMGGEPYLIDGDAFAETYAKK